MDKLAVVVNTYDEENPQFSEPLVRILESEGIDVIEICGHYGENPLDFEASHIFLTGVPGTFPHSLTERNVQNYVLGTYSWLPYCEQPVMGLCYGHQIIAQMFEGEVKPLKRMRWTDSCNIKIKDQEGIFEGIRQLYGYIEHGDYVIPPEEFIEIARWNRVCYAMKHPERDIYGLQFHPELSGEVGREIIRRFINLPFDGEETNSYIPCTSNMNKQQDKERRPILEL